MAVTTGYRGTVMVATSDVAGVTSGSIDVTWNTEDTTPFDPANANEYFPVNTATVKSVSGSFEANLDYGDTNGQKALIDELFGSGDGTVAIKFYPYGKSFGLSGNAIVSFSVNSAASSVAKVTFNYTGTGKWSIVTS